MSEPRISVDQLPDNTFWRVSAKALIYDDKNRLLVFMDKYHLWEIPGGGWEHSESLEQSIRRELAEEVNAEVVTIDDRSFCYIGQYSFKDDKINWYPKLNVAVRVTIRSTNIKPVEDDLIALKFVTKDELLALPFQPGEEPIKDYVDKLWP